MTLRSRKRESEEMNSSDIPSEKYSLAGSPLEFINGSTAMLFSGTLLVGVRCRKKENANTDQEREQDSDNDDFMPRHSLWFNRS